MKRQHDQANGNVDAHEEEPTTKSAKPTRKTRGSKSKPSIDASKLKRIISAYGVLPLQDTKISDPNSPSPDTILALVYLAMLTSTRISHQLAYKALQALIEADYHHIDTLKKSTWEERTDVLTKGGYTRYREKTATGLGQLAEFIDEKYGMYFHPPFPPALSSH